MSREYRLEQAFEAYLERQRDARPGWSPVWTASLRAEHWALFARECRAAAKASGVPAPALGFDIECVSPRLPVGYRNLAKEFLKMLDNPNILAVGGARGTGKSTLAYGLANKFCELGRSALYRTVGELFHELSDAPWEQKQTVRHRHFVPDLLILDEVQLRDVERQWQDNELTTLIDKRYREAKATILLSNLESAALRQNLGDSIWRRLIETGGEPIVTDWERIEEVKIKLKIAEAQKRQSIHK